MKVTAGTTDVIVYFKLVDPVTGVPETALTIADLDLTYVRDGAAAVKADLSTPGGFTAASAHADNAAVVVDATNAPGLYRVDVPDAAFASGVARVQLCINGAAIDPAVMEVELEARQTGDSYAVVAHASHGNAQLVRSTTPANTLTVDVNHLVAVPDTQRVLLANSNDHGGATAGMTLNGAAGLTSATGILASLDGSVTGSVASVTGAVGSVAGSVGSVADAGASLTAVGDVRLANLDAAVSTRSTYAGGAVASVTGAVGSVTGEVTADVTKINGSANAAARLALSAAQLIPGTVSAAVGAPTTTAFWSDDITEATADHYNGRLVVWTSGALAGQVTDVTDYVLDTGEGKFTCTALTEAPADNDTFLLV